MQYVDLENQHRTIPPSLQRTETINLPLKLKGQPIQLDTDFLLSIIDPVPLFLPMNMKRLVGWLILLGLVPSYIYLDKEYNLSNNINEAVNSNLLPLMIFFFAYEPVMLSIQILVSRYPSDEEYNKFIQATAPSINSNLAIIIPCHNSADSIEQTVLSCLAHTAPECIFVMDNGKSETPSDNTKEVVHAVHPNIRYFYLEKIANKTLALLVGTQYISEHHPEYKYSLIIDDDVIIPATYKIRTELFDDSVKGIVYPIRADSPYENPPWLALYQDLEYQISDLEMAFLDRTKSVIRPHGAASLWDTDTLLRVLYKHNGIFKGDDVMMGHILQHLHIRSQHLKLRIDMFCHFKTMTPQSYLGKSPNLYQQRVRSWSEAQFLYPWNLSIKPLLTVCERPPLAFLSIKSSQLYNCYTQLCHIGRVPIAVILSNKPSFWLSIINYMMLQSALMMVFNYAKLPPRLRVDWYIACTYPLYKAIDGLMGTLSFLRVITSSGASAPDNPSIDEMLKKHAITLPEPDASPKSPIRQISNRFNFFKTASTAYTNVTILEETKNDPLVQSRIGEPVEEEKEDDPSIQSRIGEPVEEEKEDDRSIQSHIQRPSNDFNIATIEDASINLIHRTLRIRQYIQQSILPLLKPEGVHSLPSLDIISELPQNLANAEFDFFIQNSSSDGTVTNLHDAEDEPEHIPDLIEELQHSSLNLIQHTLQIQRYFAESTALLLKQKEQEIQDLQQELATLRLKLQAMKIEVIAHKKNMRQPHLVYLQGSEHKSQRKPLNEDEKKPFLPAYHGPKEVTGYTPKMYQQFFNGTSEKTSEMAPLQKRYVGYN